MGRANGFEDGGHDVLEADGLVADDLAGQSPCAGGRGPGRGTRAEASNARHLEYIWWSPSISPWSLTKTMKVSSSRPLSRMYWKRRLSCMSMWLIRP